MTKSRAAIVVPCYNESHRLQVGTYRTFLDSARGDIVLIFVDDGSTDNTGELLKSIVSGHEDLAMALRMPVNGGKAEAVRHGLQYAMDHGFQYAGFWDADLATPLGVIAPFLDLLNERPGIDMIFGARVKLLGRQIERRAVRHYIGRCFATAASMILDLPIYDTQCGAKIFRSTPPMRTVFQDRFLSRWVFDVEVIARYVLLAGPSAAAQAIYEYPLQTWVDVKGTKLKARDFVAAAFDLLRIWWTYRMGSGSRGPVKH